MVTLADVERLLAEDLAHHRSPTAKFTDPRAATPEYEARRREEITAWVEEQLAEPWPVEHFDPAGYPMRIQIVGVGSGLRLRFFAQDNTEEELRFVQYVHWNREKAA